MVEDLSTITEERKEEILQEIMRLHKTDRADAEKCFESMKRDRSEAEFMFGKSEKT